MHTLPRRLSLPALPTALLLAALLVGPLTLFGCDAADPGASSTLALDASSSTLALDGASADARPAKVDVCHYDADADAYRLINVAGAALPAHLAHGDASPGEAVPTQAGFVFDEACVEVPTSTTIDGDCSAVEGVDVDGRNTLRITGVITDPAFLPAARTSTVSVVNATFSDQQSVEDGGDVGLSVLFTQENSASVSSGTVNVFADPFDIANPKLTCGPYEFGTPLP